MTTIKIKRVYDEPSSADGYRVLIDKMWPRGMTKEELKYDIWAKDVAPSTPLRKWFHEDPDSNWAGFEEKYIHELEMSSGVKTLINKVKGKKTVTLLYSAKNKVENNALVLQGYLEKTLNQK